MTKNKRGPGFTQVVDYQSQSIQIGALAAVIGVQVTIVYCIAIIVLLRVIGENGVIGDVHISTDMITVISIHPFVNVQHQGQVAIRNQLCNFCYHWTAPFNFCLI